jgi:hypothetical protein
MAAHPGWSLARIAKELAVPVSRIETLFPERAVAMSADDANAPCRYWIGARWSMLQARNCGKAPETTNPVLLQYHWCNVRRRDDWVTRWIVRHISDRFSDHLLLWLMLAYARIINQPSTLERLIGTPGAWPSDHAFDPEKLLAELAPRENGESVFRSAYRRGNHSMAIRSAWDFRDHMTVTLATPKVTLCGVHGAMTSWKGWGGDGFLAYQALIDMKDAGLLGDPPDKETWCSAGPGPCMVCAGSKACRASQNPPKVTRANSSSRCSVLCGPPTPSWTCASRMFATSSARPTNSFERSPTRAASSADIRPGARDAHPGGSAPGQRGRCHPAHQRCRDPDRRRCRR